jgi:hypothetical protein
VPLLPNCALASQLCPCFPTVPLLPNCALACPQPTPLYAALVRFSICIYLSFYPAFIPCSTCACFPLYSRLSPTLLSSALTTIVLSSLPASVPALLATLLIALPATVPAPLGVFFMFFPAPVPLYLCPLYRRLRLLFAVPMRVPFSMGIAVPLYRYLLLLNSVLVPCSTYAYPCFTGALSMLFSALILRFTLFPSLPSLSVLPMPALRSTVACLPLSPRLHLYSRPPSPSKLCASSLLYRTPVPQCALRSASACASQPLYTYLHLYTYTMISTVSQAKCGCRNFFINHFSSKFVFLRLSC